MRRGLLRGRASARRRHRPRSRGARAAVPAWVSRPGRAQRSRRRARALSRSGSRRHARWPDVGRVARPRARQHVRLLAADRAGGEGGLMRRRPLTIAAIVFLLFALTPASARADGIANKIDPVLLQRTQADATALLPVIVEMQQPTGGLTNLDRAQQAMDALRANGTAVGGLTIIDAAAGFAAAPGIQAL